MARTDKEQKAFEEGQRAGATSEQITTLFKKIDTLELGQTAILAKIDDLNSFKGMVLGAASAISLLISLAVHWVKEAFK